MVLTACLANAKRVSKEGTPQVTATEAQKALEKRSLAQFTGLEGTPYQVGAVFDLEEKDRSFWSGSGSFSSKNEPSKVNYIFLNTQTKESVKLLPKSDSIFTRLGKVCKRNLKGEFSNYEFAKDEFTKVDAIWYQVIKDGANKLEERSKSTIATSTISGENYTELIPQVDRVLNTFQSGATKILMVYELNNKYFIAELDLAAQKVIETKELANLE